MTPEELQLIKERLAAAANSEGRLDVHIDFVQGLVAEVERLQAQVLSVDKQVAAIQKATARFLDIIGELCRMVYRWQQNAPEDSLDQRQEDTTMLLRRLGWNPETGECE